jgi:hypothetical protein
MLHVITERDWKEDFALENGNYECRCFECGQTFVGHKRRITCKVCAARKDAEIEKDYKSIKKAEWRAKKVFKQNNYHVSKPVCCMTCKNVIRDYEEQQECVLAKQEEWAVAGVSLLGICDQYKENV